MECGFSATRVTIYRRMFMLSAQVPRSSLNCYKELLQDGTARIAGRRSSVIAINALHNAIRHIRRTAVRQYVELLALWEAIHGKAF